VVKQHEHLTFTNILILLHIVIKEVRVGQLYMNIMNVTYYVVCWQSLGHYTV